MIHEILIPVLDANQAADSLLKDRAAVLELASYAPNQASEVHVVVMLQAPEDEPSLELARIELARSGGTWRIQYLPWPWPTELFAGVSSCEEDVQGYLLAVSEGKVPIPARLHSSEWAHHEGLGPVDRINTRPGNAFSVFERNDDIHFVQKSLAPVRRVPAQI